MAKIKKEQNQVKQILDAVCNGLENKKAKDIVVIDLTKLQNAVCDYFVVCHGTSDTHVNALSGSVEEEVRITTGDKPWHVEGKKNAEWVLMDYVNIVVHIFLPESRTFYQLEDLWADGKVNRIESSFI